MTRFLSFVVAMVGLLPMVALADTKVPQSDFEIKLSFAPLVKQAAPAVVNIYAQRLVDQPQNLFQNDPFFRDFFRGFGAPQPRLENSLGSGVILSDDGIVVSNYHVVGQAQNIRVVLNDKREYSAQVLLADQDADLAILQMIDVPTLPNLALRDSDTIEVGELVLAIGNPFGVGQTVSSGIVSGLARSGGRGGHRGYFIQTDAPINPGNSGGALVDIQGNLIGINTSILSRSGGSNGIGFAIPASLVAQFLEQAQQGFDTFQRPWAGIDGGAITAEAAQSLGLQDPSGMIVLDIHDQSPFKRAGIMRGDVITHVDGQPVNGPAEMLYRLTIAGLGAQVDIRFVNDRGEHSVAVMLSSAPNVPPSPVVNTDQNGLLPGMVLRLINPAVQSEYRLPLATSGVLVAQSGPTGARLGIKTGDIILAINDQPLDNPQDFDQFLNKTNRRGKITLLRDGRTLTLRFRI